MSRPMIHELLPKIAAEIGVVGKSGRNDHQNYNFRGIEHVVDACHPAFTKHGVTVAPSIVNREHREVEVESRNGKRMNYVCYLTVGYTFTAPDGSKVEAQVEAEGHDTSDKATNKAMSAALKYALGQVLLLPFNMVDSEDARLEGGETARPKPAGAPKTGGLADDVAAERDDWAQMFRTAKDVKQLKKLGEDFGKSSNLKTLRPLLMPIYNEMLKKLEGAA